AGTLAADQICHPGKRRGRDLLPRLRENARALVRSHLAIAEAGRQTRTVSPAAEWLLNNFHVVEEQVREIQEDLPPGFYRELPKLSSGELEGYPRVYGMAWAFVAHTDRRIALVRAGRGLVRPRGQPDRARPVPPLRPRVPACPAADDRRALGAGDLAAG